MAYKSIKGKPGVQFYESAKKRFNGRPDRCFYITYGKPKKREKIGWASEGYTAEKAAQERQKRIQIARDGVPVKEEEITLDQAWEVYYEYAKVDVVNHTNLESLYRNHLKEPLGHLLMDKITPARIEQLRLDLVKQGYKPQTQKHILGLLRTIFNRAILMDRYFKPNPFMKIKMPKVDNKRQRFLSPEEIKRLLDALAEVSPQSHDIALLAAHAGMRRGEIFGLMWEQLDFENGIINVMTSHGRKESKGRMRAVPMTAEVREMLQNLPQRAKWVFPTREGNRRQYASSALQRTIDKLGFNDGVDHSLNRVSLHTLRHSFASIMVSRGVPLGTVQKLLGHESQAMTERYSKVGDQTVLNAMDTLQGAFTGGS